MHAVNLICDYGMGFMKTITPIIYTVFAVVLGQLLYGGVAGATPRTQGQQQDNYQACQSLKHCIDIIRRHDRSQFDFDILAQNFSRFGVNGHAALLAMAKTATPDMQPRALDIIARAYWVHTLSQQQEIAALWPSQSPEILSKIFTQNISQAYLNAVLETLSHDNEKIAQLSRQLIKQSLAQNIGFAPRTDQFAAISQGAIIYPNPALITLLEHYPPTQTRPVFQKLLRSGDKAATAAAYRALYKDDPQFAFDSLLATLFDLTDGDIAAAIAIGAMLNTRHKTREDGFYMIFAGDIARDPNMGPAGQAAGFHALFMQSTPDILPSPQQPHFNSFKVLINSFDHIPKPYQRNVFRIKGGDKDPWLTAMWPKIAKSHKSDSFDFIIRLGRETSPAARAIVDAAAKDTVDYNIKSAGLIAQAYQDSSKERTIMDTMINHDPIMPIRAAAAVARDIYRQKPASLTARKARQLMATKQQKIWDSIQNDCSVNPDDFKITAEQMPFFDSPVAGLTRPYLATAYPVNTGWLAGYNRPQIDPKNRRRGALVYYDYDDPHGDILQDTPIQAIIPVITPPLGQFASAFWIITGGSDITPQQSRLYHYKKTERGFQSRLHLILPGKPSAISVSNRNDITIAFNAEGQSANTVNPPLTLNLKGDVKRTCPVKSKLTTVGHSVPR